nr:MAG TPA: hypothetical protein [Caudoviricetes sp.]
MAEIDFGSKLFNIFLLSLAIPPNGMYNIGKKGRCKENSQEKKER